jgi:hypothetical protein
LNGTTGIINGTVTSTGTTAATISAINVTGSTSVPLSVVILPPYSAWQNMTFSPAQLSNPGISGDTADPANDGIANLLKYAFDLNPFTVGVAGMPTCSTMTVGGSNYMTLTYTQVIWATDLIYLPEVSSDLQTWNSGPAYTALVSITNNLGEVTQTVVVQDLTPIPPTGPAGRFIRLQVIGP